MTKITLITGASRGLGRNAAISIARRGGDVIVTYQSKADEAKAVVAEIESLGRRAAAIQLDMGDSSKFEGFANTLRTTLHETWQRDTFDHLLTVT